MRKSTDLTGPTLIAFALGSFMPASALADPDVPSGTDSPMSRDLSSHQVDSSVVERAPKLESSGPSGDAIVQGDPALRAVDSEAHHGGAPAPDAPVSVPGDSTPTALPTGADKSGVTSKAISVPQGAGKIEGMG